MAGPIEWQTDAFQMRVALDTGGAPCIEHLIPRGEPVPQSASPFFSSPSLPLNSVRSPGEGNTSVKTSKALIGSYQSQRLQYLDHSVARTATSQTLDITSQDLQSGVKATQHFEVYGDIPVLRSWTTLENVSQSVILIDQASSLAIGGLVKQSRSWWDNYVLMISRNSWFREAQWHELNLADAGIGDNGLFELNDGHQASMATFSVSNQGSFSTGTFLPIGCLRRKDDGDTWLWQVEHNGSWRWEVGDFKDDLYLAAGGPTWVDHSWRLELAPGQTFTTVPVACAHVSGSVDAAFAALTDYRRRILRPHSDHDNLPIIFNDYMNCLMGDPDEQKIKALLEPVANTGASYFVIDAGWYSDDNNWWDDVGLWEPSKKRFPSGFKALLDTIRSKGLIPGVWLEPEVVGVRSVVAHQLPEDAFFQQAGKRVIERGRFQLDYRHPAVRARMNSIVDKLITHYGVGYFKFDYNIEVMSGSDVGAHSAGAAHLDHQRSYLAWVSEILDRHPHVVIENCSSGAQRMDYAMLSVHALQSTSDQQDPVLYAAIAAAVPTAVVPEQSATWAYPQKAWSDEINALTVVNSLLGRIHLSGRLDELEPHQYRLIVDGMDVYKSIRSDLKHAHPFWPIGLPKWRDHWLVLGMALPSGDLLLSVWRRGGPESCSIPLPEPGPSKPYQIELLYPQKFPACTRLQGNTLEVQLSAPTCARLFRVRKNA